MFKNLRFLPGTELPYYYYDLTRQISSIHASVSLLMKILWYTTNRELTR